jgi:hypothetical protein
MRKWFTCSLLIVAMLGGAVGVGAHEQEGICPLTKMADCCKKALAGKKALESSMARLCCNLNCSEPASSGSNTSSSFSSQPGVTPIAAVIPNAVPFNSRNQSGRFAHLPRLEDSSPRYIQHLALLI